MQGRHKKLFLGSLRASRAIKNHITCERRKWNNSRFFSSNQKVQIKETEIASYGFLFPPKPYCVPARCCALLSSQIIVFPFSSVQKKKLKAFSLALYGLMQHRHTQETSGAFKNSSNGGNKRVS